MMTDVEMTDAEVADQIERADRFIADFREMIAATVVDPASPCADDQRRGLQRIAATLDAVPYVTMCNLANLNAALRGGLLDLIEVQLMCVGGGPTLDYADAAAVLRCVRADDREGAQAAAAMMDVGDVADGNAGKPDVYRTGRRDGRGSRAERVAIFESVAD